MNKKIDELVRLMDQGSLCVTNVFSYRDYVQLSVKITGIDGTFKFVPEQFWTKWMSKKLNNLNFDEFSKWIGPKVEDWLRKNVNENVCVVME